MIDIAVNALGYEREPPKGPSYAGTPMPVRGTPINRLSPRDQGRIAAILVHLGWVPRRTAKERWWEPK
jgi:hypothetical protein